jgi:hypothetical protein
VPGAGLATLSLVGWHLQVHDAFRPCFSTGLTDPPFARCAFPGRGNQLYDLCIYQSLLPTHIPGGPKEVHDQHTMSLLPPLAQLTPEDRGGAVVAVAYALIVTTILFSIIRVLTTFALKRKFGWDDALLILAVALGLVQSILTEKSAVAGLGKHFEQLSPHQLDRYYKVRHTLNLPNLLFTTRSSHMLRISSLSSRKWRRSPQSYT